jgi:rRNA-processing protein FCF1
MNSYVRDLLERYRKKGILIDTNLLLMYFLGSLSVEEIPKFKRTQKYTVDDFYILSSVIEYVENVVTTPNILTEVSNLSWQLPEHLLHRYTQVFVRGIKALQEHSLSSAEIAQTDEIHVFGLTDAGIFLSAKNRYLVITDDFRLSQYLQYQKVDAINFNHIRNITW